MSAKPTEEIPTVTVTEGAQFLPLYQLKTAADGCDTKYLIMTEHGLQQR